MWLCRGALLQVEHPRRPRPLHAKGGVGNMVATWDLLACRFHRIPPPLHSWSRGPGLSSSFTVVHSSRTGQSAFGSRKTAPKFAGNDKRQKDFAPNKGIREAAVSGIWERLGFWNETRHLAVGYWDDVTSLFFASPPPVGSRPFSSL